MRYLHPFRWVNMLQNFLLNLVYIEICNSIIQLVIDLPALCDALKSVNITVTFEIA